MNRISILLKCITQKVVDEYPSVSQAVTLSVCSIIAKLDDLSLQVQVKAGHVITTLNEENIKVRFPFYFLSVYIDWSTIAGHLYLLTSRICSHSTRQKQDYILCHKITKTLSQAASVFFLLFIVSDVSIWLEPVRNSIKYNLWCRYFHKLKPVFISLYCFSTSEEANQELINRKRQEKQMMHQLIRCISKVS